MQPMHVHAALSTRMKLVYLLNYFYNCGFSQNPVGKIAEKAVCKSVF